MSSVKQNQGFILIHRDWSGWCVPSSNDTVKKKSFFENRALDHYEGLTYFCVSVVPMCSVCTCTFLQLPSHSGDEADHFLGSLLNVCKCVSGSSSPLWAPSPCDSGISDDPLSDHLDSPPPSSNLLFDSFFISQHQHPHPLSPPPLHPPQQSQQQQQQPPPPLRLVSSSADQEISIDVGKNPVFKNPLKAGKIAKVHPDPPSSLHIVTYFK